MEELLMFFKRLLMVVSSFLFILSACTPEHSKIVVAEFDDIPVTMGEFENAYSKNLGGPEAVKNDSIEALKKFLDLYVDYKIKLRDAFVRGYTADPDLQKEIADYKANIGSTLYLENYLYEPGMKKLYDRRKWELRASHIFLVPDSSRNQEQCIEFAKQLIDSIKAGKDFAVLAKKYSKDVYSKDKGGDVYYFTAGQTSSSALEDACYNTPVGQVYPEPVNSGFGIHVIKVTDKNERIPSIRAEHILISKRDSTGKPITDTLKAFEKITEIKKRIDDGEKFEDLAQKYSEDKGSALAKGDLGYFGRGKMVKEFDEVAFKLAKNEVSPIIKTQYGYHIIKVLDRKAIGTYDEEKKELREIFKRSEYKKGIQDLVAKLEPEFGFMKNETSLPKIILRLDTLKVGPAYWGSDLQKEIGNLELFKMNNRVFTTDSLISFMQKKNLSVGVKMLPKVLMNAYDQFEVQSVINEKGLTYDKENKEFANLMEEYANGVYLFKILEKEVWSKINVDSNSIESSWEKNKENYRWKDRVEFKEIFVKNDSIANSIYQKIQSGQSFDSLATAFNQRKLGKNTSGYVGLVEKDVNETAKIASEISKVGEISKPQKVQEGYSIVKLINREGAGIKTFEEAKAEVASAVQESESKRLENEYLNNLKTIYKPKFNYDELQKAFKE
jgi:peptidyl-prolyl cis-trans isomerase SurA